jgi:selenocysteine lyase/cysteine desulfurase
MERSLYLDTARLGRLTPCAQQANGEFTRFAAEEACPPYFEDFLAHGADACPNDFREKFPALGKWPGIAGLKARLRELAHSPTDLPVLLANRSAQLMKFAARWLFRRCDNVLIVDASWPAYRGILECEGRRADSRVSTVAIHDSILLQQATADEVVANVESAFTTKTCDGLFLPAVTHDGIRLPITRIVKTLESKHAPIPVVIDGAQDFCHTPTRLNTQHCDLYLAGCHKWLGGYYPMGLAFYGRRRSADSVENVLQEMLSEGELDDPLLRFSSQLETDSLDGSTETVNLGSLFTCFGASLDIAEERETVFQERRTNAEAIIELSQKTDWRLVSPSPEFQSAVVMLEATGSVIRELPAKTLRTAFEQQSVSLSAYHEGRIRLSMPEKPLSDGQLHQIQAAFRAVS